MGMKIYLHELDNTEILGDYPELIDYFDRINDYRSSFYYFDKDSVDGFRKFVIDNINCLYEEYGKDYYTKKEYIRILMNLCKQLEEYIDRSNKNFIIEYN